jgi:glycerate 2-kinase
MSSSDSFWTSSLRAIPEGKRITRILSASIDAVEPGEAVKRSVKRSGDILTISGKSVDLQVFHRVVLLGMGKASLAMTDAVAEILGSTLNQVLVITKHFRPLNNNLLFKLAIPAIVLESGHPAPDERSLEAGQKAIELVSSLGKEDLLICLISGGGSALMTAPVEGISLADMQELTSIMLASGLRIDEINALRRRLDQVKGGGIAKLANGATVVSLILSDVIGNPLEAIASGPTAPDPGTREQALSIIAKYHLENKIPASIYHTLETSVETPKPGDPIFDKIMNVIVGSNLLAAQAAITVAEEEGFHPYLLRVDMQGEARQVAFELSTFLRNAKLTGDPNEHPACIVVGGETTVTLKGNGKGGRNTELALAAVKELAEFPGVMLVTLATDGEDGPTDAAGAVVSGGTFQRATEFGMQPQEYLERNDSYSFFSCLDDLIKPGPTGTNVNDLVFLFLF